MRMNQLKAKRKRLKRLKKLRKKEKKRKRKKKLLLNQSQSKLIQSNKQRQQKKIKLPQSHSEMEDNGLMICHNQFKMVEVENITGLLLDQVQMIMIIDMQIKFMRNLKLKEDRLMNILIKNKRL